MLHNKTTMPDTSINYRNAQVADVNKLSILYKQVYIQTYGTTGVSDEFANFIMKQFAPEKLAATINDHPGAIIVAEFQGNLVGVAEIAFDKCCPVNQIIAPELSKLYILEWFCGKGIGHALIQLAEAFVASKGYPHLWLWVLISNQRAISFYKKENYLTIGQAPFKMEVNTYDNYVLWKDFA